MSLICEYNGSKLHPTKILNRIYANGDFDVHLVSKNKRIPAHRVILSANSDFFRSMFNGSAVKSEIRDVSFNGLDVDALEACVRFCYTGKIKFTEENIFDVISISKLLQFDVIEEEGWKIIGERLKEPEKILPIIVFSLNQGNIPFFKEGVQFILKNMSEIKNLRQFRDLDKNDLIKVMKEAKKLGIASDEEMWNVFNDWINTDRDDRIRKTEEFLVCLRLETMPVEFLWRRIRPACRSEESLRIFDEANNSRILVKMSVANDNLLYSFCLTKKTFSQIMTLKRGIGYRSFMWKNRYFDLYINQLRMLDISLGEWTDLAPVGEDSRFSFVIEEKLYIVTASLGIKRFNFPANKWITEYINDGSSVINGMIADVESSFAVLNKRLYLTGGNQNDFAMVCYDFKAKRWLKLPNPPENRNSLKLVPCQGSLYAFGGHSFLESSVYTIEKFDPTRNKWLTLPKWTLNHYPLSAANVRDQIFIITSNNQLVTFNTEDRQITPLANCKLNCYVSIVLQS